MSGAGAGGQTHGRLVLATHNAHKLREFQRLMDSGSSGSPRIELEALAADFELPPEEGETFAENALVKARAAARASGRPTHRR